MKISLSWFHGLWIFVWGVLDPMVGIFETAWQLRPRRWEGDRKSGAALLCATFEPSQTAVTYEPSQTVCTTDLLEVVWELPPSYLSDLLYLCPSSLSVRCSGARISTILGSLCELCGTWWCLLFSGHCLGDQRSVCSTLTLLDYCEEGNNNLLHCPVTNIKLLGVHSAIRRPLWDLLADSNLSLGDCSALQVAILHL